MLCLLLAASTAAVYWPVPGHDFLDYDDPDYFTANPYVQRGLTREGVKWAFCATHASNWHPLTWLSLMLDAELFGKGPAGPHSTNLVLHAANSVVLFLLLRRLTGARWPSALVAALFALHPMRVETVAWLAERKGLLSTFFGLLTLRAYARYVSFKVQNGRLDSQKQYGLALLFFALGLMSKPMLVTWPFVMLLLDYWPLQRFALHASRVTMWRLVREKLPFFALSLLSCVVTVVAQKHGGAVQMLTQYSLAERMSNVFVSYARYLGKAIWPVNLALPYPHPGHWPGVVLCASALLLTGLSAFALWQRRRRPFLFVGWFLFLGTLIPVIGLVQVGAQSMADRYSYVPLIGLFVAVIWAAAETAARFRVPKTAVVAVAGAALAASAARTADQLQHWRNTETLFRHALAATEDNAAAHNGLAVALARKGSLGEAISHLQQALRFKPHYAEAHNNLGIARALQGNLDEATRHYTEALRLAPNYAEAHYNLGLALALSGSRDEAITSYTRALQARPDYAEAHNDVGYLRAEQGRFDEALTHLNTALRLHPTYPQAHFNLGRTLARLGRRDEAVAHLTEALRLKPDYAEARRQLRALGVPRSE